MKLVKKKFNKIERRGGNRSPVTPYWTGLIKTPDITLTSGYRRLPRYEALKLLTVSGLYIM